MSHRPLASHREIHHRGRLGWFREVCSPPKKNLQQQQHLQAARDACLHLLCGKLLPAHPAPAFCFLLMPERVAPVIKFRHLQIMYSSRAIMYRPAGPKRNQKKTRRELILWVRTEKKEQPPPPKKRRDKVVFCVFFCLPFVAILMTLYFWVQENAPCWRISSSPLLYENDMTCKVVALLLLPVEETALSLR